MIGTQLESTKAEMFQLRKELEGERQSISHLEKEMDAMRIAKIVRGDRRICTKENQRRVEKERVDMEKRLNNAIEDQSLAEDLCVDAEKPECKMVAVLLTFQ